MVCSELELGLGEDHGGIMILPADAPVACLWWTTWGTRSLSWTSRGAGIACRCWAWPGCGRHPAGPVWPPGELREPLIDYPELGDDVNRFIAIEIADPDLCPRYSATLIRGVKIGPSPRWLQERVIAAGMRPISNIVDITNYVMWETGQPLHAFDYDRIHGQKIIVRRAMPGETIVSLDNQVRELTPEMCMIADVDRSVAIGGSWRAGYGGH